MNWSILIFPYVPPLKWQHTATNLKISTSRIFEVPKAYVPNWGLLRSFCIAAEWAVTWPCPGSLAQQENSPWQVIHSSGSCQFENMLEECGIHPIIYYINHDNDFPQMGGKYHPQMIYHDQNKWLWFMANTNWRHFFRMSQETQRIQFGFHTFASRWLMMEAKLSEVR